MKFYQTLKQAPRSMKHGKHRRASPPAHGHPVVRAGESPGGADEDGTLTFTYVSSWPRAVTWYTVGADFAAPEPTQPAVPYAGIRTGELIGYRLWWIIPSAKGLRLCSLAHKRLWEPGETLTGDLNEIVDYMGPIWGGIYAFSKLTPIAEEIENLRESIKEWESMAKPVVSLWWHGQAETSSFALGTIKMWGETMEHQTGYRSEFAKLNSIDAVYGDANLEDLRAIYKLTEMPLKPQQL